MRLFLQFSCRRKGEESMSKKHAHGIGTWKALPRVFMDALNLHRDPKRMLFLFDGHTK